MSDGPASKASFELIRVAILPEGAFGVLLHAGLPFAVTLERTYSFAGRQRITKIRPGRYVCERTQFHRGCYETYEITGVVGHERILFHRGNWADDSDGCVLVGESFAELHGRPAIADSRGGFDELIRRAAGREAFALDVREVRG